MRIDASCRGHPRRLASPSLALHLNHVGGEMPRRIRTCAKTDRSDRTDQSDQVRGWYECPFTGYTHDPEETPDPALKGISLAKIDGKRHGQKGQTQTNRPPATRESATRWSDSNPAIT